MLTLPVIHDSNKTKVVLRRIKSSRQLRDDS